MNENEGKTNVLSWQKRIYLLVIVILAVVISYMPTWIVRFCILNGYKATNHALFFFFSSLQISLMLICPFVIKRIVPELCDFEIRWLRKSTSEVAWCFLMPFVVVTTSLLISKLVQRLGLPISAPIDLSSFYNNIMHLIVLICLIVFIGPPIGEMFWRGFIQNCLCKVIGPELSLLVQACIWALLHFYPLGGFINIFVLGLIFGFWQMKRKTLLPIIIGRIVLSSMIITASLIFL